MKSGYIPGDNSVFRATIHPLAFRSKNTFIYSKAFMLTFQDDGSLLGSLVWERYAPTTEHIHSYSCRLASSMNKKHREQSTSKPSRIYCGSYHLEAAAIRKLGKTHLLEEVASADVIHHIENGEIAHADLRIVVKESHHKDEGTKTAIVDRLWNSCHGPLVHKCECDKDIHPHPGLHLDAAPEGVYSDTRSDLIRLWHIIRFAITSWMWRIFGIIL